METSIVFKGTFDEESGILRPKYKNQKPGCIEIFEDESENLQDWLTKNLNESEVVISHEFRDLFLIRECVLVILVAFAIMLLCCYILTFNSANSE